jgi:hypothetical protein
MPPQQCPRRHQEHGSRREREMNGCGDQECSIRHPELRPSNLARQNLELVPQHQQLNVLHVQTAAAPNKRTQEGPKREVEKGEGHAADPPNPRAEEKRHRFGALQGAPMPPSPHRSSSRRQPSRRTSVRSWASSISANRLTTTDESWPYSRTCGRDDNSAACSADSSLAMPGYEICPRRDSNPRYGLERAVTWAASRRGPAQGG